MPFMEDMEVIDFRTMLDRLREWPVATIDLMGGEPTLHHELPGLLRETGRRGLRVNMSSNGTNIPRRDLLPGSITFDRQSINDRATFAESTFRDHRPIVKMVHTRASMFISSRNPRPKAEDFLPALQGCSRGFAARGHGPL
jgi:organic radical activating enzyme